MRKFCLIVLFIIAFSIFIPRSSALAYHDSFQPLYDWGPWYETSKQHVLGVATNSVGNKEGATNLAISQQANVRTASGFLPNNPLYFIKPLTENIQLFFSFDPVAKMEKQLWIAEERLAEINFLLEQKYYEDVRKILITYNNTISDVSVRLTTSEEQNAFVENFVKKIESDMAKQSLFLEKVRLIVPEETRIAIDKVLVESKKTMDTSADILNRDPMPVDLRDRLESLNAIGVISDAEASALFSLESRSKVRFRIESLVAQKVLPSSDIKRLDEAQNGYYPSDYYRVTEISKIYELKNILDNPPDAYMKKRLAEFGSRYKSGDFIPPDLKPWWLREQRLQELQNTLRPDIVINSIIAKDSSEYKEIESILRTFRPSVEQLVAVDTWIKENPNKTPPPEIERIVGLAANLGTPISWTVPDSLKSLNIAFPTQFNVPAGFPELKEIPKTSGQTLDPTCPEIPTKAKHATTNNLRTFPTTCLPPDWYPYSEEDVYRNPLTGEESFVITEAPHVAVPSCGFGVCKVQTCESGWHDRNGVFTDGCESQEASSSVSTPSTPYTSPTPGSYGVPTSSTEAPTPTTAPSYETPSAPSEPSGSIAPCQPGYYDKNGSYLDGCESMDP